jgi:NAD(P)H-quinone oxidoreductase subunit 3
MRMGDSRRLAVGRECLSNVPPTGLGTVQKIERLSIVGARSEDRVQAIWYIIGFAIAAGGFAFLTFGAAWLISHRNRGDIHKGLPYESGIDTYGDTHGRFGLSFYIYALLFVAFDIEVVFIYLWALIFRDPATNPGLALLSMFIFVAVLLFGLAYAWRKGVLTWR